MSDFVDGRECPTRPDTAVRDAPASTGLCAVVLLTMIGSGSVSAAETLPPETIATTVVKHFDVENSLIWSQVDDQTIEVSLPD